MPHISRSKSTASRRNTPSTSSDLNQLTTEVLRLCRDQLKLSATGSRQTLLARPRAAPQQVVTVNQPNVDPKKALYVRYNSESKFEHALCVKLLQWKRTFFKLCANILSVNYQFSICHFGQKGYIHY